MHGTYSPHVNSKRKILLTLFATAALLGAGCGGLGASGSISPATFLLPGLGHIAPQQVPAQEVVSTPNTSQLTAHTAAVVQ